MAKQKNGQKFELDDLGFSAELDIPDFGFDTKPAKDDRKPVTKAFAGFKKGVRDQVASPAAVRNLIKNAMPKGYGMAVDLVDNSLGSLRNLYNNAAREVKPAMNELRRTTQRALPSVQAKLPKKVAEKLKRFAEGGDNYSAPSADQQRESMLAMQLGEIFQYNAEQDARRDVEGDVRDKIKEGIDQARHRDQLAQLDGIRRATQQALAYKVGAESRFQRKSLELQFRQFFIMKDMVEMNRKYYTAAVQELQAITKNTALPEFLKIKQSESLQQMSRNRMLGALSDGVFARRDAFVRNLGTKANDVVMKKLKDMLGGARMALSKANMVMDATAAGGDMGGPGMEETAGNFAGGIAGDAATEWFGKKLAPWLAKRRGVMRMGNKLEQGISNLPQHAKRWSNSSQGETGWKIPDMFLNMGKDITKAALGSTATQMERDTPHTLGGPDIFSRRVSKSITEVIPGFLARIYQELQITRTGNEKTALMSYDFGKNSFGTAASAKQGMMRGLFGGHDKNTTRFWLNEFIDKVDPKSELTPEQRSDLAKQLLKANMNDTLGDKSFFTSAKSFQGPHSEAFAGAFQKHLAGDASGEKEKHLNRNFQRLGSDMQDVRGRIQEEINNGNTDALVEAGVLNRETGQLNMAKVYEYFAGEDSFPAAKEAGVRRLLKKGKVKGFAAGGAHMGGVRAVGEQGVELEFTHPSRILSNKESRRALQDAAKSSNEDVVYAIRSTSSKVGVRKLLESMLRIESRLQQGVNTFNAGDANDPDAKRMRKLNRGLDMSLRDAMVSAGKFGGRTVASFGRFGNAMFSEVTRALGRGMGVVGAAAGQVQKGLEKVRDRVVGIRDVWLPGEKNPRMTAWKLKAGLYRDKASGKVIKTFKDISGAVIDDADSEVLSAEEAKLAFVKYGMVKKGLQALGATLRGVNKFIGELAGNIGTAATMVARAGNWAFNRVTNALKMPQDVYANGSRSPKLTADGMRIGMYYSQKTRKPIRNFTDIDGVVVNSQGDVKLSEEDIEGGLHDKNGKPLRNGWMRVLGKGTDALKAAGRLGNQAINFLGSAAKGFVGGVGKLAKGLLMPDGIVFSGGKKMVDRLTEIRDLLRDRLPKTKKVLGDIDGDGVREGSVADMLRKAGPLPRITGSGLPGLPAAQDQSVPGLLKQMLAKLKSIDEHEETIAGNSGESLLSEAGDAAQVLGGGKGGGAAGKAGKLGKFAKFGRGALKWGMRGAGLAGTALGAYSAYENVKEGNYGAAAIDGGLAVASGVATVGGVGALTGAGGAMLAGAGALATGAAAILASPVVLGALAVGAVAGAGYLAYKYATRKKLGTVSKVRYAQYGFAPDDTDHLQTIFGLEDKLEKAVTWSGEQPDIDPKKVDMAALLSDFGINDKKPEQLNQFARWFQSRFKPVFLTHLAALKAAADDKTLADVDDFKGEQLKRYLNLSRFSEGPYGIMDSPFPGGQPLAADARVVGQLADAAQAEAAKDNTEKKSSTSSTFANAVSAMGPIGMIAGVGLKMLDKAVSPAAAKEVVSGAAQAVAVAGAAAAGSTQTATATFTGYAKSTGELDAISVIRFKTYGLQEMVMEKVRALQTLEQAVLKGVSLTSGTGKWDGSVEAVLTQCGPAFGVEGQSDNALPWIKWFQRRFLPTFLNYLTALKQATGKAEPQQALMALKPRDAVDVASAVYSSAVWGYQWTPWPGYVLNTEVRSTEANFQALKEDAKKVVLNERTGSQDPKGAGRDNGTGITDGTNGQGQGLASPAMGAVSGAAKSVWSSLQTLGSSVGEAAYKAVNSDGPSMLAGGRAAGQMGDGTGGALDQLPMPKGDGKYEYFQELFAKVAKMVGVDPKLMATMAAIESGFRSTVQAGTSSATGLFQFIRSTWSRMVSKYGSKYGIGPNTSPTDPRANALLGAEFIKENAQALKGVKADITDTDLYLAHFLGPGGAKQLLKANPSEIAATLMPQAASANQSIFYEPNGSPRTVAAVYAEINRRVRTRGQQFGLDAGGVTTDGKQAVPQLASAGAGGGRGSVNPDAADPSVGAPAIPVADTSPAPQVQASAAAPEVSMPAAPTGMQPVAYPAPMSPRAAVIQDQQQTQRADMNEVLGGLGDSARAHLGVATEQLGVLKAILKVLGGDADAPGGAATAAPQELPARKKPVPPVSMGKMALVQ